MRFLKLFPCLLGFLMLIGCGAASIPPDGIAATTAPVAQFAHAITHGTDIPVTQIVSDSVSCLHDYSLSIRQMETVAQSRVVLLSGGGLEDFMEEALASAREVVDCSRNNELLYSHGHEEADHHHEQDPHLWLSPRHAIVMAETMCDELCRIWPEHSRIFRDNLEDLLDRLEDLDRYGQECMADLSCRQLITFHDGFAYLADAYGLEILAAMEEESGSEASAADLIEIVELIQSHDLPAVFTEINGSPSAASIIARETGVTVCSLNMAMGERDYFEAMTYNFDTLKEALQ